MNKLDKLLERTSEYKIKSAYDVFKSVELNEEKGMSQFFVTEKGKMLISELIQVQTLVDEVVEKKVGSFRADILFHSPEIEQIGDSKHNVVIENQLNRTDHDHLGKMITYASNEDIKKLVWIAGSVREEHVEAIKWLNENSKPEIEFYLSTLSFLEIENGGALIPVLKGVVIPNAIRKNNLSETQNKQLEFWESYKDILEEDHDGTIDPKPQNWYVHHYRIGITGTYVISKIILEKMAFIGIRNQDNDKRLSYIREHKKELADNLNINEEKLDFDFKPNDKSSEVKIKIDWEEKSEDLHKKMKEMFDGFTEFLNKHKEELNKL